MDAWNLIRIRDRRNLPGPEPSLFPGSAYHMVDRRFAFDLDVLQRLMATVDGGAVAIDGDEETLAAVRLLVYADTPILLPEVEAELVEFANMASVESFPLERIAPDDFFRGCAKAKSDAYLQFHPDPRDCHLVGEAECAQLDALVTLKTDLLERIARTRRGVDPHASRVLGKTRTSPRRGAAAAPSSRSCHRAMALVRPS